MGHPEFTQLERHILSSMPFAVMGLVAGADGRIDKKETERFSQMLEAAAQSDNPLLADTMARARDQCTELLARVADGKLNSEDVLKEGTSLIDGRLSSEDGRAFKLGLVMMGENIAQASGGGLLGMGERTDKDEQLSIARVRTLLGL